MQISELNRELLSLDKKMAACRNNKAATSHDIEVLMQVINVCPDERFYRLKTYMNDRYFLNEEMLASLTYAKNYLTSTEKMDIIYNNYLAQYGRLAEQYKAKTDDPDYQKLYSDMREVYICTVQKISYEDNI